MGKTPSISGRSSPVSMIDGDKRAVVTFPEHHGSVLLCCSEQGSVDKVHPVECLYKRDYVPCAPVPASTAEGSPIMHVSITPISTIIDMCHLQ